MTKFYKASQYNWKPLNLAPRKMVSCDEKMDDESDSDDLREWFEEETGRVIKVRVEVQEAPRTYRKIWEWVCDGSGPKSVSAMVSAVQAAALEHVSDNKIRRAIFKVVYTTRKGRRRAKHITMTDGKPCPDCKGTGEYVGFSEVSDCHTCEGNG